MAKGHGKSSATSATRKKHAKKQVGPAQDDILSGEKRVKNKDKNKKKEPRPKMYIPPVKPAPLQPDPLETTGLTHTLPPDLLVVLRSFNKKAQLTKIRALEELQVGWVDKCGDDDELLGIVVEMLPVWFHHVSALFVHPSRRVRFLAASLHASLIQLPAVRDQMFFLLTESASPSQQESLLGSWCMAAHDVDRSVAASAFGSWKAGLSFPGDPEADQKRLPLDDRLWSSLVSFIQRAALDPLGIYQYLNPVPPVVSVQGKGSGKSNPTLTSWKDDSEQTSRSKGEEMDEGEQDRRARLRIGAFGALRWALETSATITETFVTFLSNPALWTALHHGSACPWLEIESFGFSQPNVRKSAWALIQTLLASHKDTIESLVPILSTAILRSAWAEIDQNVHASMWHPLLTFLKRYPKCWENNRSSETEQHNQGDSNSDSENDVESGNKEDSIANFSSNAKSLAYQEFLQFLQLGCSGSPLQGYPTVVIVISTIPSSVFATTSSSLPLDDFFISFWAALDGRALSSLNRAAASAAFLSSLFECMTFLLRRIRSDNSNHQKDLLLGTSSSLEDVCNTLVTRQLSKVWEELTTQRLKVPDQVAGQMLGQTFESLQAIGLFDIAWSAFSTAIKSSYNTSPVFVSVVIKALYDRFKGGTMAKAAAASLVNETLNATMSFCEQSIITEGREGVNVYQQSFELLVNLIEQFGDGLFQDEAIAISKRFDLLMSHNAYLLTVLSPSLILSYLHHRNDDTHCLGLWHSLLDGLSKNQASFQQSVAPILDAAQKGLLPNYLTPKSNELDVIIGRLLTETLCRHGVTSELILVRHILLSSSYFISNTGYLGLLQNITSAFDIQFNILLQGGEVFPSTFQPSVDLMASIFKYKHPNDGEILMPKLPNIFLFAYLLPECGAFDENPTCAVAKSIWTGWLETSSHEQKMSVSEIIKARLRALVCDTEALVLPEEILNMVSQHPPGLSVNLLTDIVPSETEMEEMLDTLSPDSIDPSIAVIDPIVPPSAVKHSVIVASDSRGFSSYARVTNALLHILVEDRVLLKQNTWTLRHFIALSLYAHDFQRVPSLNCPAFDSKALTTTLSDIIVKVEQVTTYILRSLPDDRWQSEALNNIMHNRDGKHGGSPNYLTRTLLEIIKVSRDHDRTRDCRILKIVLDHVLDDMDKTEADMWVQLARKYEKYAPETAMTILHAISESGVEPPQLDRYRNEVAASLLGIQAKKANSAGLLALRRLASTAPDPESDVIFLPDLRAVNVIKACQQWIASDEDIDEEVESAMTGIFLHLAPIVQNVPGAHWDFIFDVLESNLENSSITENTSLVALARSLRLIIVIQNLASTNKSFRSAWLERQLSILTAVRDLATTPLDGSISVPRSICRELVLSIVQDLPGSLIDQDTLPKMCHLITDPSKDVQKMAYQLLHTASRKRTEYLVIEAGVDSEAAFEAKLPAELLIILDRKMNFDQLDEDEEQNIFGYFLGWMLLFDLFRDASFKVRSSYIEQLRNLDIISTHFLPAFLRLLRLDEGLSKAFKLDIWAINEYYVELYEPGTPFSVSLFAAHLFYRALLTVPSLIHSWVLDCKDRQLITAVTSYTSQHFSPVIIHAELAHVKSPASQAELADENLSIKVATAVNEVVASYLVDEHQLEIKLKIPSDWPLHRIEVRDVKRVGVDENRWRAWVLAVQQIIWSHNGRIVDGLSLFKKNVTLHFEGQVECAICYSIISVMDGSLPRKPCRTCKNRFHAGCLYKWFNTSHSSSCPLCRSDII